MRLSKKPWQRSSERGRGKIKCYRRKVGCWGWTGGWGGIKQRPDSQFTVPAIEIREEKGILGYENHTGGLRLLMQMLPNFSFIGPKVLPSPRKPLWRLGKCRLEKGEKRSRQALPQCLKDSHSFVLLVFFFPFSIVGLPSTLQPKRTPGLPPL